MVQIKVIIMAERRMMSKKIIHSDMFMDLPATTKNLYFYLMIEADDDGFVNSPKRIQRMIGATDDDSILLVAKKFVITFESGVIVIKHWRMHNYIRSDRHKGTSHTKEMEKLTIKDSLVYQVSTNCQPSGSIGKVRLGEVRLGKDTVQKQKTKFELFIENIELLFEERRILTFKSKINTNTAKKVYYDDIDDTDCAKVFTEYVKRNKTKASRLDKFITAYREGMLSDIEHLNTKTSGKQPQVNSLEWERQQLLKQQEGMIDAELI